MTHTQRLSIAEINLSAYQAVLSMENYLRASPSR